MVHPSASRLRRWTREPLIHFAVLGAALFGLHQWLAPPPADNQIVLSASVIQGLRQDHLRRNGTLPTKAEEAGLIQRYIDNEVMYREALKRGLDRGDIIVRRRLIQKMEFLTEDLAPIPQPTDRELQTYLDAHRERYAVPTRLSLTQVFVSTDRHPLDVAAEAARLQRELVSGANPSGLGDPFLRGQEFHQYTERELAGIFGPQFATRVVSLAVGSWSEPIASSYGLHLVRVTERTAGYQPKLAEVRTAVARDWRGERRTEANRNALDRLRQSYHIRIAGAEGRMRAQVATSR